jgi:hypothetical protein
LKTFKPLPLIEPTPAWLDDNGHDPNQAAAPDAAWAKQHGYPFRHWIERPMADFDLTLLNIAHIAEAESRDHQHPLRFVQIEMSWQVRLPAASVSFWNRKQNFA